MHTASSGTSTERLAGETSVDVECLTPRAEPSLCDGYSETINLNEPARIEGDRIILPGFDGRCPQCGGSCFRVNGVEAMFHV